MRTIQTFVLRLLTTSEEPQTLRGTIHAVSSGEEQPFTDGPALLALLRRMVNATPERVCDVDAREGEEEKGQK